MNPLHKWHDLLAMPKYDEAWHRADLADELAEYHEAHGLIDTWSELSDLAYTYSRAQWSGHSNIDFPFSRLQLLVGIVYMLPKYTLRWRFFRALGHQFDSTLHISEVRNPKKVAKLAVIAEKYDLDPDEFTARARQLMRYRIFLK